MKKKVYTIVQEIRRAAAATAVPLSPYVLCCGILLTVVGVFAPGIHRNVWWDGYRAISPFVSSPVPRRGLLASGLILTALAVALRFRTTIWERRQVILRRAALCLLETIFLAGLLFLLLWSYNQALCSRFVRYDQAGLAGLAFTTAEHFYTLDLFPYEGWHVQANVHLLSPIPGGGGKIYDIKSGSMGFFTSINLAEPPAKQSNEVRIILIGGSGAQGWGASSNQCMMYSLLEKMLDERFSTNGSGARVSVINLAMGASVTYQNFIALNRWGHRLKPDLILSYSGRNDFFVPVFHEGLSDAHYLFNELNAQVMARRTDEIPPGLQRLHRWFPNIFEYTSFGRSLKVSLGHDFYRRRAAESYKVSRGLNLTSEKEAFEEVAKPLYVNSLKSIKRDFEGIPMVVAWQAIDGPEEAKDARFLGQDFYNQMFRDAKAGLESYYNDQWYFLNVHQLVQNRSDGSFGMHLDDRAQEVVAGIISDFLTPVVFKVLEKRMSESAIAAD